MPNQLTDYTANQILAAADLDFDNDLIEDSFDLVGPWVSTGLVPSAGTGLSVDVTAGAALIGMKVTVASPITIGSLAATNTNHLYLLADGTGTSNTTGTQPAGSVKLGTATTDGTGVTSVDTSPGSGRQTRPSSTTTYSTLSVVTKTTNYTATDADDFILVDASGGAVTITLMAAASRTRPLYVKKIDSSANGAVIDANGAETIDGATTQTIAVQYASLSLISNGASWSIF